MTPYFREQLGLEPRSPAWQEQIDTYITPAQWWARQARDEQPAEGDRAMSGDTRHPWGNEKLEPFDPTACYVVPEFVPAQAEHMRSITDEALQRMFGWNTQRASTEGDRQ